MLDSLFVAQPQSTHITMAMNYNQSAIIVAGYFSVPSVLIIGTYRQTLTIIRSVARAGYRVILGICGETAGCEYSRYVDETWRHPDVGATGDQFVNELNRFLDELPEIKAVFPVGENELRFFLDEKDRLPCRIDLLMSDPESIHTCLDKPAMSAIVDELGIPQANHATVSDCAGLFAASDAIGYPCIVKPTDSSVRILDKKVVTFGSAVEIREVLSSWPPESQSLIVQKHVSGQRHNMYFFSRNGRIDALASVRILRTDTLDQSGLAVSGITVRPDPVLVAYCEKMTQRLNYQGAGCAQFLVDTTTGEISFLELNPRLGANFAIVYRAGIDLPLMMIDAARGKSESECESTKIGEEGVRYAWTTGDIVGLKNAVHDRQVSIRQVIAWLLAMIKANLTSAVHITWDWRDPMPSIALVSKSVVMFAMHLIGRKSASPQQTKTT